MVGSILRPRRATHDSYLLVCIVGQNLVGISAVTRMLFVFYRRIGTTTAEKSEGRPTTNGVDVDFLSSLLALLLL